MSRDKHKDIHLQEYTLIPVHSIHCKQQNNYYHWIIVRMVENSREKVD